VLSALGFEGWPEFSIRLFASERTTAEKKILKNENAIDIKYLLQYYYNIILLIANASLYMYSYNNVCFFAL
jgi:hypothetical protein